MADDRVLLCEYGRNVGEPCSEPAESTLTVDVLDSPDPPFSHHYCRRHGMIADIDIAMAAVASGRLGVVTWKVTNHSYPLLRSDLGIGAKS